MHIAQQKNMSLLPTIAGMCCCDDLPASPLIYEDQVVSRRVFDYTFGSWSMGATC